jgi:hypothetical protein
MISRLESFVGADWDASAAEHSDLRESYKSPMSNHVTARKLSEQPGLFFSLRIYSRFKIQILGLAAAICLWGIGYKLSLYHHHPHPATVSAAKLWVDPRGPSTPGGLPTAKRWKAIVEQALSLQPLPPRPVPALSIMRDALIAVSDGCRRGGGQFLNLLRSPPLRLY